MTPGTGPSMGNKERQNHLIDASHSDSGSGTVDKLLRDNQGGTDVAQRWDEEGSCKMGVKAL